MMLIILFNHLVTPVLPIHTLQGTVKPAIVDTLK